MENEPLLLPWRLNNLADNMEIKHLSWHGDGNTLIPKESTVFSLKIRQGLCMEKFISQLE